MENYPQLITTQQLIQRLHVHRRTVYKWCKMGMPNFQPTPHSWRRFDLGAVLSWLAGKGIAKVVEANTTPTEPRQEEPKQ